MPSHFRLPAGLYCLPGYGGRTKGDMLFAACKSPAARRRETLYRVRIIGRNLSGDFLHGAERLPTPAGDRSQGVAGLPQSAGGFLQGVKGLPTAAGDLLQGVTGLPTPAGRLFAGCKTSGAGYRRPGNTVSVLSGHLSIQKK